jgi:hypothetical protein
MRLFLLFVVIFSFQSCSAQKNESIYLSHCDSLFYVEGESINPQKIKRGKMTDSTFINGLFNSISPATHKILFKPYIDICIDGDGMGPVIEHWKAFFFSKGFSYEMAPTDSTEDNYFGNKSIRGYINEQSQSRKSPSHNDGLPPPPPPPPMEIIVTEDGKPKKGANKYAIFVKAKDAVTFLLSSKETIYYYEGIFNGTLHKTDINSVGKLIKQYKDKIGMDKLMFLIKADKTAFTKNVFDLFDQMSVNGIRRGHYGKVDITAKEIKSINNFKEN